MISLRAIYRNLPKSIKLSADYLYGAIPNEIKYGKKYRETKALLFKSQWWSEEEQIAYQEKQMKSLLIHSYEHVPYYKKIFDNCGFNPYTFRCLDQVKVLPLLNKNIIQENFNELLADNFPAHKTTFNTTGGTSGNQLKFCLEKNYEQVELPFVEHIWGRVGYTTKSSVAVLRNQSFENGKLFVYDWKQRKLVLDNFHLTDSNIKQILNKICQDKIEFIHTYPSAVLSICDYIRRLDYRMSYSPKAILATSENLYSGQKELIESTLNCRVFTFYGHSERACIAGWCEDSDLYHVQSEYGYMELLDENQKSIDAANKLGEIVCTGFFNKAMPFIRYQTADYSSYTDKGSCSCGRNYKLLNSIEGRWMQEMLVCKDGSKVSITALNMHSDIFENVKKYQLYQDTVGLCFLNIVKAQQYSDEDEKNIKLELIKKLGNSIELKIIYMDDIEKTQRGKFKYLIQKLSI